jgi:NMD protein affecting ribosome stability and mRNA decay
MMGTCVCCGFYTEIYSDELDLCYDCYFTSEEIAE